MGLQSDAFNGLGTARDSPLPQRSTTDSAYDEWKLSLN
jgi:hypothetical protein